MNFSETRTPLLAASDTKRQTQTRTKRQHKGNHRGYSNCTSHSGNLKHFILISLSMDQTLDKDSSAQKIPSSTPPEATSCRKKKSQDASFVADMTDHIDEFIHASMDEHITCFQKTMKKMFGMSKAVKEKGASSEPVESGSPVQSSTS
ncbi:uncharacterized protein LOC131046432 [Cryptomeria japonica]|uniref:uncharacterized protein LOC131046432 n=1 Tax=Cryptomeria japonica TaxID=3369 RepID=UPI0025ABD3DD|nr:uncharacterized protein LOC131046432 [Cryptomeria japonica]